MHSSKRAEFSAHVGDYNEAPDSVGRYAPAWVAAKAGLTIYPPPRGKHGRIDFVMSDADVRDVRRVQGGESDHGLIVFDVVNPLTGEKLRGGTWNVERDRRGARVDVMVDFIEFAFRVHRLDFLAVQEVRQYHQADGSGPLARIPGLRLVATTTPDGARHNAILVAAAVKVGAVDFVQMSREGWFLSGTTQQHTPLFDTRATLDGWLRVSSVHETVGVDWIDGQMTGPELRVRARRQSARRRVREARRVRANRMRAVQDGRL